MTTPVMSESIGGGELTMLSSTITTTTTTATTTTNTATITGGAVLSTSSTTTPATNTVSGFTPSSVLPFPEVMMNTSNLHLYTNANISTTDSATPQVSCNNINYCFFVARYPSIGFLIHFIPMVMKFDFLKKTSSNLVVLVHELICKK